MFCMYVHVNKFPPLCHTETGSNDELRNDTVLFTSAHFYPSCRYEVFGLNITNCYQAPYGRSVLKIYLCLK